MVVGGARPQKEVTISRGAPPILPKTPSIRSNPALGAAHDELSEPAVSRVGVESGVPDHVDGVPGQLERDGQLAKAQAGGPKLGSGRILANIDGSQRSFVPLPRSLPGQQNGGPHARDQDQGHRAPPPKSHRLSIDQRAPSGRQAVPRGCQSHEDEPFYDERGPPGVGRRHRAPRSSPSCEKGSACTTSSSACVELTTQTEPSRR